MASSASFSASRISHYILLFGELSVIPCQRYFISGCRYVKLSTVLRRCSHCVGMSKKCVAVFWSVLERQRAEVDDRLRREEVAEERVV